MTREEAIRELREDKALYETDNCRAGDGSPDGDLLEALDMAIEALSADAIAKAHNQGFNQGFVEGSVYATVNSNYVCPRCGEKMERKEGGDDE